MAERNFTKTINFLGVFSDQLKEDVSVGPIYDKCRLLGNQLTIILTQEPSAQQDTDLTSFINGFVDAPTLEEQMALYLEKDVDKFVKEMIYEFAAENIAMGITQAGKTKAVADELRDLNYYMRSYSLYEVMAEIDRLIAAGIDPTLAPFMTDARMTDFKNKIAGFLA